MTQPIDTERPDNGHMILNGGVGEQCQLCGADRERLNLPCTATPVARHEFVGRPTAADFFLCGRKDCRQSKDAVVHQAAECPGCNHPKTDLGANGLCEHAYIGNVFGGPMTYCGHQCTFAPAEVPQPNFDDRSVDPRLIPAKWLSDVRFFDHIQGELCCLRRSDSFAWVAVGCGVI